MSPDDSFADMEMQKQGGMLASGMLTISGRSLDAREVPEYIISRHSYNDLGV